MTSALVIGAGVGGLCAAVTLQERGVATTLVERSARLGDACCSWLAGGMLAPGCEGESAPAEVVALGSGALAWWAAHGAEVSRSGTLVVAPARDGAEIDRFARRTQGHEALDEAGVVSLEPELADRFRRGLFFREEGHLDPRAALMTLLEHFEKLGGVARFGEEAASARGFDSVVDARGWAARDVLTELRPVRGEMLVLRAPDVRLTHCVRLVHPRIPLYVVPRGEGVYMVGATMIESGDAAGVSVRSATEMMNAAYALHPGFGEAEIVEMRADLRPAFADNVPRVVERAGRLFVNGFYRHGYLMAPALADEAARRIAARLGAAA